MSETAYYQLFAALIALLGVGYSLSGGLREREKEVRQAVPSSVAATRAAQANRQRKIATTYAVTAAVGWLIALPCCVVVLNLLLDADGAKPLSTSRLLFAGATAIWLLVAVYLTRTAAGHVRSKRFR